MPSKIIIYDTFRAGKQIKISELRQMCGRGGRDHSDKNDADAYFLLNSNELNKVKNEYDSLDNLKVDSGLSEHFAFHVISRINTGEIYNKETFLNWYSRTLDYLQRKKRYCKLPEAEEIFEELSKIGACRYDKLKDHVKILPLGKIASVFYFSPYDVWFWYKNLSVVVSKELTENDIAISWMLSNVPSLRSWFNIKEAKKGHSKLFDFLSSRRLFLDNENISAFVSYYDLLEGRKTSIDYSMFFRIKNDFSRMLNAIKNIIKIGKKSLGGDFSYIYENLESRVKYSVSYNLLDLVKIEGVGKTVAKNLYYNFDIKNEKELMEKHKLFETEFDAPTKRAINKLIKKRENNE